ncbi:hypothetical protein [Nannocystis bainbridge]|uniref:Uncharacterized protein n=1 Tax=Nannocystis bainbridge TaxID=2995303 RepID=A0ABT5DTJ5_9BACT|nr:hypothetical protein [Nannocystis bainbridge]MDC0716458.1 hypothetical protein [Nannocystis bainbridge]
MRSRPPAQALLWLMALTSCLTTARADSMPEEELYGFELTAVTELSGLSRFPEHVFYVYPAACTETMARFTGWLETGDENPALEYQYSYSSRKDDLPHYFVVGDGEVPEWIGDGAPCIPSVLYALARDVAATVDLAPMTLAQLHKFFTEDPRLFRSSFEFQRSPLYANNGSPLRAVRELVRVLHIGPDEIVAVLDSTTYRFEDGTEQTLKLAHTKRPPSLPFKPLKPDKLTKYADKYAKWEARQPLEPPPAPRLPVIDGADTGCSEGTIGTEPAPALPVEAPALPVEAPAPDPVAAPPIAAAPAPVAAPSVIPPPPEPEPAEPLEDVSEDMVEETAPATDPLWPMGAAIAGGLALVAVIALARRPRATT